MSEDNVQPDTTDEDAVNQGTPVEDQDQETTADDTSTHPAVGEARKYRKRAQEAETRLTETQTLLDDLRKEVALQKANSDEGLAVTPAALWGVATLEDLLDDDGKVDDEKVSAAVAAARKEYGIERTARRPRPVYAAGRTTVPQANLSWTQALSEG